MLGIGIAVWAVTFIFFCIIVFLRERIMYDTLALRALQPVLGCCAFLLLWRVGLERALCDQDRD